MGARWRRRSTCTLAPAAPRATDERSAALEEPEARRERDPTGEFPPGASELGGATRRDFIKLLGASLGVAGMAGCTKAPPSEVRPYTRQPRDVKPGVALHYATTMALGGVGTGLLVTSREGRPVKIEGSPEHPASLGAAGIYEQAAIYHLYDPQRARSFKRRGRPASWSELIAEVASPSASFRRDGGAGLRFLVEPSGSPLLASLRARVLEALPNARFTPSIRWRATRSTRAQRWRSGGRSRLGSISTRRGSSSRSTPISSRRALPAALPAAVRRSPRA